MTNTILVLLSIHEGINFAFARNVNICDILRLYGVNMKLFFYVCDHSILEIYSIIFSNFEFPHLSCLLKI
jgi:hypothetical protein